jgi:hypothetical protein
MVARWGLDRAILSLCAARICRLVLADAVRDEAEENLLIHAVRLDSASAEQLLDDYAGLLKLASPETVPYPSETAIASSRHLIRHLADVPVLLSAKNARPDWLLTHNTKHFTPAVARRTGLRIATPAEFFRVLSRSLS